MKKCIKILFSCVLLSTAIVHGIVIVEPSAKEAKKSYRTVS